MSNNSWVNHDELKRYVESIKKSYTEKKHIEDCIESLTKRIESFPIIKKAKINVDPYKVEIEEKKGLMKTYIGGEVGQDNTIKVSTSYANFFKCGDLFSLTGKYNVQGAPSFDISFSKPIPKGVDFSRLMPFQTHHLSIKLERNLVSKIHVDIASLSYTLSPIKNGVSFVQSLSLIKQPQGKNVPMVFNFDPSPYLKISSELSQESGLQMIGNSIEASVIVDKMKTCVPFLKLKLFKGFNLGFGLSGFASSGFILSQKAVPFYEKFLLGGVPLVRGTEQAGFGYKTGKFPCGNDFYVAGSIDESLLIFPQYQLNGHIFLNGAYARNFKSNSILDKEPSPSFIASAGAGVTFVQGAMKIEANVQTPLLLSKGQSFLKYQIGVSPL